MEACCLCRRDVSAETHKKKRKKLHGQSAAKARELLESVSRRERQVGLLEYDETRDGMFDGKSLIYGILPLMFDKVRGELVSTHNSHTPSNLSNSLTDIVLIFSILYRMQWKHCTMHQSSNFHHDGSESQILTSRHYH